MTINTRAARIDTEDADVGRHWSPQSEKYASAEALVSALDSGWRVDGVIFRQEHWYDRSRRASVYHVRLSRELNKITMVVVDNPFISRILGEIGVQIVQLNQRKEQTIQERW